MCRWSFGHVGAKNKKEFANDLKTIYHAPSEEAALKQLERVTEKWEKDDPNAMKSWYKNWDVISPIFKFSADGEKGHLHYQCDREP